MGLLEDIAGSLLRSGQDVSRQQSGDLVSAVIEMLGSPQSGGLDGLARKFGQHGLGDVISSWIGTGKNEPIAPDQLSRVLEPGQLLQLARRAGLSADALPGILAALLPVVVDKLTPNGRVAPQAELLGLGRSLLEGRMAQGGTQMASGDKPKPDFSDVKSGGSSTAPAPGAAARTYTVAAGDSLSKIAKKLYGDGNQWHKIFDANRDQIKNPDLVRPGQVLKIP